MAGPEEVIDLAAMSDESQQEDQALAALKRNLSHLRISAIEHDGPEIDFGDDMILKFKAKVPTTAMAALVGTENKVEGLRTYIRLSLKPESRQTFEDLLDDLPLEALNAIVEVISEASTSFPTE